ncbi:MAG: DNA-binding protein [Calditrichaceae bacterium]|nr:ribbon-helix-helix domain-containing protein [Calditrichia bacterium]NUQ41207.1 DNA-binding protein [Calditrichaceae bacterium]
MRNAMQTISARVPEDIVKKLAAVAKETERPVSFHVIKALEYYLSELVDLQIALDRLNDPTDELVSLEEAKKELGL